jgi:hypothetical protein
MGNGGGYTTRNLKRSLYRSCNIVRVIKSRILRWAGLVATIEYGREVLKILPVNLYECLGADKR